ncbi:MAG: hypothetical protein J7L11_05365 [Thermoprotei archaeon]|nr:hypothetical protein [Thermoprotei archaeon]
MSERIKPVHAQGFFTLSLDGLVNQVTVFDYMDPDGYYASLLEDENVLEDELWKLVANMQEFLDQEKVIINGRRVKPKVRGIDICWRGDATRPSITFFITFQGRLRSGLNAYEDYYEPTIAEYDYEFYWIFPPQVSISEALMPGKHEIVNDRILMVWVHKGTYVEGYERIAFWVPQDRGE